MVRRVLIADDNPEMRKLICRVFEPQRIFELCAEAVNGADAIAQARIWRPDLIILDLSMPVMNGIEAARAIHREMPRVPIILYTLYVQAIPESEAAAHGIKRVVAKNDIGNLLSHANEMFRTHEPTPNKSSRGNPGV
ncbi:MAG: response regulator [Candidatus Acidiferrales bacterium]